MLSKLWQLVVTFYEKSPLFWRLASSLVVFVVGFLALGLVGWLLGVWWGKALVAAALALIVWLTFSVADLKRAWTKAIPGK